MNTEKIINEAEGNAVLPLVMPRSLTAGNGAKSLLNGEFFETVEIPNEEYCGCGECW